MEFGQTLRGDGSLRPGGTTMKATANIVKVLSRTKTGRIIFVSVLLLLLIFILIPAPSFPPDYSILVLDSDGEILHATLNKKQQWCFPPDPESRIPAKLETCVLEYEDRYFRSHPGVNPVSIIRALRSNARPGGIRSGASTITMQVARIARPKPRTLPNKILEMTQALKLEILRSKTTILRTYLDHAPYGRNVVGVQAASRRYFGRKPDRLSWAEAATLAVLPNQPGLIAPGMRTDLLRKKRDGLLHRLALRGRIDKETLALSLLESVPSASEPFPPAALHLARALEGSAGGRFTLRTTIDREIQLRVEALTAGHVSERLRPMGIRNAAVLVAETRSGKVRAYVGSQDFFDAENGGQVDGVRAPRSPGSLLKPFLYGLAMDEGILLPETRIRDVPTYYGAFSPSNASESYDGLVTAKEALVRSLNVPAVRVLYGFGVRPFYLFLKKAGLSTLFRDPDEYGLPLILGGAEVTAWDMTRLYRGLASGGRFPPLAVLENGEAEETGKGPALISPGACWLTLRMLRELKRPEAEAYWELYRDRWPIAWKTGTSYGFRDGWAAGVSPQWTIVVWAGNFDGEGNANLAGASCAGTLMFAVHNALPKSEEPVWFEPPVGDLEPVSICSETGFTAGPDCPPAKVRTVEAPRFMKPLPVCPYHQKLFLSADGRMQVCSACWGRGGAREEVRLVYPPDVAQFLRESGKPAGDATRHNPACGGHTADDPMDILYPQPGARLWIPRDLDGRLEKVMFRAAHREAGSALHWYLDGVSLGATRSRHSLACVCGRGGHELVVVDGDGRREKVHFTAEIRDPVGVDRDGLE
jgi:penicillin-binding protein 1C